MPVKATVDLKLYPYQKAAICHPQKYVVWVGGRRSGKTTGAARFALKEMLEKKHYRILWIDTVYRNILRYASDIFVPLLSQLPKGLWSWNAQRMVVKLWNESEIAFGSHDTKQNLEGFGYDLIILNEAGIILWNEGFYHSTLRPMGIEGEGAQWLFVGTPKGNNRLKIMFDKGQDDLEPDWISTRTPSFINPLVDETFINSERNEMPIAAFEQEYLAQFREDANFFTAVEQAFNGELEVEGEGSIHYTIGLDLARDVDFTVAWVGRVDQRRAVCCERYNKIPWPEQVAKIQNLAARFNNAELYVDATGLGVFAVDDLRLIGLNVVAITFTNETKTTLAADLATDLEQSRLVICPHEETSRELKAFQRTPLPSGRFKLEAPSGYHDDCVIALALMVHGFGRPTLDRGSLLEVPSLVSKYEELF